MVENQKDQFAQGSQADQNSSGRGTQRTGNNNSSVGGGEETMEETEEETETEEGNEGFNTSLENSQNGIKRNTRIVGGNQNPSSQGINTQKSQGGTSGKTQTGNQK